MSLRPIVSKIGDVLLWLLKDILLPIAKWGIENGIPAAFDLISAALKVLNSILDALKPLAMWLRKDFLQPFGEWTGKIIIEALKKVTEWLTKFSDWISEHKQLIEDVTIVVLGFFAAFAFESFVSGVGNMLSVLPNLIGVLGSLVGKLDPLTLLLGLVISLAAYVATAWDDMTPDEKLASKILAVAGAIGLIVAEIGLLLHDPLMLGIGVAIAAIAGIAIAGIASSAKSRAGAYSSGSYSPYNTYSLGDVSSYRMPRLATGTVVPPRAGEFAAILGDNNRETEVVSPLSTIEQALDNVMAKYMGEGGNRRPMQIDLIINGQRFARAVYEANNQERQRVGVRMITEG